MFIAVIASIVQLVEMLVEKFSPALYGASGNFLAIDCGKLRNSWWIIIYARKTIRKHW